VDDIGDQLRSFTPGGKSRVTTGISSLTNTSQPNGLLIRSHLKDLPDELPANSIYLCPW
jgi:hypothetical protein